MILPFLYGIMHPERIPVTFLLLSLNLIVFSFTYGKYIKSDVQLRELLEDEDYLATQGQIFAQMIKKSPDQYSDNLLNLADAAQGEAGEKSNDKAALLGFAAIRHPIFLTEVQKFKPAADEVEFANWRSSFDRVVRAQEDHPLYGLGLNYKNKKWTNYLTYQFAHSGWLHLLMNMTFLLLFGGLIELRLGFHWLVAGYLLGGIFGGLTYSVISGISGSPLVGASGSVCALMSLVAVTFFKERLYFLYWFLPFPGYFGFLRLPGYVIFLLFALPDIGGVISSVEEIGYAVAHTAHLGGSVIGLALGGCWLLFGPGHGNYIEDDIISNYRPGPGTQNESN